MRCFTGNVATGIYHDKGEIAIGVQDGMVHIIVPVTLHVLIGHVLH
jgi:hypothetical protein